MNSSLKGNQMRECYISVDIEATGPTPGSCGMYELGACVIGQNETFEKNLALMPGTKFDAAALRTVGTTKRKLLNRGDAVTPVHAMDAFARWARKVAGKRQLVFVANNAPFDWMFVAWYLEKFGVTNPFGHSALDMKAYFMGLTGCTWKDATLANMARHAGVHFEGIPHNALQDAIIQGRIFDRLLNLTKETL